MNVYEEMLYVMTRMFSAVRLDDVEQNHSSINKWKKNINRYRQTGERKKKKKTELSFRYNGIKISTLTFYIL